MSEPRRMVVRTAPRASPLLEALVVTLHDGRVGFAAPIGDVRQVDGAPLLLYAGDVLVHEAVASVLRSGAAYDEVLGRTRDALPWWVRSRLRAASAVVVLRPEQPA